MDTSACIGTRARRIARLPCPSSLRLVALLCTASVAPAPFLACGGAPNDTAPSDPSAVDDASTSPGDVDAASPSVTKDAGGISVTPEPDGSPITPTCSAVGTITLRVVVTTVSAGVRVVLTSKTGDPLTLLVYEGPASGFGPGDYSVACAPGQGCRSSLSSGGVVGGPIAGTVHVTDVSTPLSSELRGTVGKLEIRSFVSLPVEGGVIDSVDPSGACLTVDPLAFDGTTPPGTPCTAPSDCGSLNEVCDPATLTCQPAQCSPSVACPGGKTCRFGAGEDPVAGACYAGCAPFAVQACAGGGQCLGSPSDEVNGLCFGAGAAGLGAACQENYVSTGCALGLRCDDHACRPLCDHFAPSPGCPAGSRCSPRDACVAPAQARALGEVCGTTTTITPRWCGDDGKALRGVCGSADLVNATYTCRALCGPGAPACPVGTTCRSGFDSSLGAQSLCLP